MSKPSYNHGARKTPSVRAAKGVVANLALRQQISADMVYKIQMGVLAHFDACKRGRGTTFSCNLLTLHLYKVALIANMTNNGSIHAIGAKGYAALSKAALRSGQIDLSTTEYKAIREALSLYLFKLLPRLEWKQYLRCEVLAFHHLSVEDTETMRELSFNVAANDIQFVTTVTA